MAYRLYEISEAGEIKAEDGSVIAQIEKLSDGTYNLKFDTADLDALAESLGITSEAATACMQAQKYDRKWAAVRLRGCYHTHEFRTVFSTFS